MRKVCERLMFKRLVLFCISCQFERMKRRMQRKSRRLNPPKMPSYNESVVPKKPARKSRTPSPDNSESSKEGM